MKGNVVTTTPPGRQLQRGAVRLSSEHLIVLKYSCGSGSDFLRSTGAQAVDGVVELDTQWDKKKKGKSSSTVMQGLLDLHWNKIHTAAT